MLIRAFSLYCAQVPWKKITHQTIQTTQPTLPIGSCRNKHHRYNTRGKYGYSSCKLSSKNDCVSLCLHKMTTCCVHTTVENVRGGTCWKAKERKVLWYSKNVLGCTWKSSSRLEAFFVVHFPGFVSDLIVLFRVTVNTGETDRNRDEEILNILKADTNDETDLSKLWY